VRFTLKQVAYFVAAAETGSITLASERANISQPSISSAISVLEETFGIQLFVRHHAQGLSLTTEGRKFLVQARALLAQAEELQHAATEISARIAGPLDIGCLATLFPLVMPALLHEFSARHPAVAINAIAGNQAELFEHLRTGRISVLLTYDMNTPPRRRTGWRGARPLRFRHSSTSRFYSSICRIAVIIFSLCSAKRT
jgi:DNA-binding transcriptional LysR family regulator